MFLVKHKNVFSFSHFKLNNLFPLTLRPTSHWVFAIEAGFHLLFVIKALLSQFPLFIVLFSRRHYLLVILGQYFLFIKLGDITGRVVLKTCFSVVGLVKLLFSRRFGLDGSATGEVLLPLFLFLLDKFDELFDVFHRIEVHIIEVFTLWAVHELVLLAGQICDYAFQNWWDIPLTRTVQLEIGDHICELFQVSWGH